MEEAEVDGPCKCVICGDTLEDGRETFMVADKGIAGLNRANIEIRGKGDDDSVYSVRTWDFQRSIITACDARLDGDSWAQKVQDRIIFARDLVAVDAVYYQVCNVNFRNNKRIPERYRKTQGPGDDAKVQRLGRPVDTSRKDAFLRVVDELRENDDEQTTVADIVARMFEITSHPTIKWMKEKLMDYLGDSIVITNINGISDVVTFRTTAAKILQAFYDAPRLDDEEMRKRQIIRTAAQLIKTDIKCMQASKQNYPEANEIRSLETNLVYLPETLRKFLNDIFSEKSKDLKVASIGQCIVQMTRPRLVLAPIPFGIAVQMHHQFGSRFLIDSLASHGLCASYSEVINYSKCAASCFHGTDIPMEGHFALYIADNVDHDLKTLDGHGTFHGMGIIAAVTPGLRRQWIVPRMSVPIDSLDDAKIAIKFYKTMGKEAPLVYEELPRINVDDRTRHLNTMWKISWSMRPIRPGWSGTMQAISKGTHLGKASIHFLPMIDMDPTDMNCVYSTLHYIATENRRQGSTPIVTFDQLLWWKSKTIILHEGEVSELKPIVLILGGFHTCYELSGVYWSHHALFRAKGGPGVGLFWKRSVAHIDWKGENVLPSSAWAIVNHRTHPAQTNAERHTTFDTLQELYVYIIRTLDEMINPTGDDNIYTKEKDWNWDAETRSMANGLRHTFTSFEHIVSFVIAKQGLEPMCPLVSCLQGEMMDVYPGFQKVHQIVSFYANLRSTVDDFFSHVYDEAIKLS
ncbi:hypothetical protein GQR58_014439 [Nymphon striatum]|nr:hypothetical protein GQR58_014439 [Nymphon striatum]